MPELSPHAQAIKDAVLALYSDEKVQKFGWLLDVRTVAATLRAAADQVVLDQQEPTSSPHMGTFISYVKWSQCQTIRIQLLAIADELESQ
jgi:hypothetical protein